MARSRGRQPARRRVGRVSYYLHHGAWHVYYREGKQKIRRRVAETAEDAERIAAQINAQLLSSSPTLLAFTPVTVHELRLRFLDYHEQVQRSTLGTLSRYRSATKHMEDFVAHNGAKRMAHEIRPQEFATYLRSIQVAPNGHANTQLRPLRDKGILYNLETCRSMYAYAGRMRHLPPYTSNPFTDLRIDSMRVEDAKPIFVFDASTELAFFQAADDWAFPIHFALAKTGLRPGELAHLLIEDLDLQNGWLLVRNKLSLGWRIKTGLERPIPLIDELVEVLQGVIRSRAAGPVFLKECYGSGRLPAITTDEAAMAKVYQRRLSEEAARQNRQLSRVEQPRIARTVWRDAGAIDPDRIRASFVRTSQSIGLPDVTCPKSWRHTFATLLQDANVDPLIRQLTPGHKPSSPGTGALGMTSVYTHSRPETQRREIHRALRQWPESLQLGRNWAQAREC